MRIGCATTFPSSSGPAKMLVSWDQLHFHSSLFGHLLQSQVLQFHMAGLLKDPFLTRAPWLSWSPSRHEPVHLVPHPSSSTAFREPPLVLCVLFSFRRVPAHASLVLSHHSSQIPAFFSVFQLPCNVRSHFLRGVLHVRLSRLMQFSVAAQLLNLVFSVPSSISSPSGCPISSGLTAALLTVFDSLLNANTSRSAWRCLSLASVPSVVCPSQASSQHLHLTNVALSAAWGRHAIPTGHVQT